MPPPSESQKEEKASSLNADEFFDWNLSQEKIHQREINRTAVKWAALGVIVGWSTRAYLTGRPHQHPYFEAIAWLAMIAFLSSLPSIIKGVR